MSAPWLSDLSEDWKTPSSTHSSSLPRRPATSTSASAASRIPRLSSPAANRSKPQSTPAKSKRTLSERSRSDINIPPHSSPAPRYAKSTASRLSRSSSSSAPSAGSVVRLDTAARKARSSSPPKPKSAAGTPDWRRLVMKAQNNPANANLLNPTPNPIGLEGIFQKPDSPTSHDRPSSHPSFSFLQDLESMPSSPPPWPKNGRGSSLAVDSSESEQAHHSLAAVQEQEEPDVQQSSHHPASGSDENQSQPDVGSLDMPLSANAEPTSTNFAASVDGASDVDDAGYKEELEIQIPEQSHSNSDADVNCRSPDDPSLANKASSSAGTATSSAGSGFSPVFISKHNGADGRIDYAAVDLSNPDIVERLRQSRDFQSSSMHEREPVLPDQIASDDLPSFVGAIDAPNYSGNGRRLAPISEFVSMGRGDPSDNSSFMHRPLSPSASSSIVPSDSVSQVHGTQNRRPPPLPTLAGIQQREPQDQHINLADSCASVCGENALAKNNEIASTTSPELDSGVAQAAPQFEKVASQGSATDGSIQTVLDRPPSNHDNANAASKSVSNVASAFSSSSSEPSAAFDLESPNNVVRPSTPQYTNDDTVTGSPSKRAAPLPSKSPTPKRLRTLSELEHGPRPEYVSNQVEEQHRRMQAIIGKRKDARYGDASQACDPEALAKREILRPRNYASTNQRSPDEPEDSFDISLNSNSTLRTVQEHIEQATLNCNAEDEAEIKALASEVATLRIIGLQSTNGEIRKQSVSTQDYVDEAMKIMELIRSKRAPPGALSDLEEQGSDSIAAADDIAPRELTPQTISRPPSREGVANAWRTRFSQPLNSEVASQLQRFQESGDESLIATSAIEDLQAPPAAAQDEYEQTPVDEESADIRILQRLELADNDASAPPSNGSAKEWAQQNSPPKKYGSNKSTDSSGRTVETTSTQKTRTLPFIGPSTVSHLLRAEEAGMRYDPDRQTWVKCRNLGNGLDGAVNLSSSTGTEDDPFGAISDLSVDDLEQGDRREDTGHKNLSLYSSAKAEQEADFNDDEGDQSETQVVRTIEQFEHGSSELSPDTSLYKSDQDDDSSNQINQINLDRVRPKPESEFESAPRLPGAISSNLDRLAKAPAESAPSKRRDVSVLFSSPPVSKQYPAQQWSDSNTQSDPEESVRINSRFRSNPLRNKSRSTLISKHSPNRAATRADAGFNSVNRELSLSCINEHHEVSFIGTHPDGRAMSLTLSVSTPLPSHRYSSRPVIPTSGPENSNVWSSLSPLTEFSFHQDDLRHFGARQLSNDHNKQLVVPGRCQKTAVVVESLVQKLTDVEPDEPYWDFMRALQLQRKDLTNLYTLDEFCPRIEELDVSDNGLHQLNGAPPGIRQLDVKGNRLSSLSSWDHLANLQYLDISGNVIESLEGLSSLVHLRDLKADDNKITSLEGLLDLDGLISLSIRRNKLEQLDFQGTAMKRLSTLYVENNYLHTVSNLHCLPSLSHLDLSGNRLSSFPCQGLAMRHCPKVETLRVANNMLEMLDVALFSGLHTLDADDNRLGRILNLSKAGRLCSVFARSQKPLLTQSAQSIGDHLDDFSEIHHLYLSGNFIPRPEMSTPFLNLKTFELAFGGVQSLPADFGVLAPNLRLVNLNSNALKDLRPLRGVKKLDKLFLAGNRLARLRKTVKVLATLPLLRQVDMRDNPLTLGYYPLLLSGEPKESNQVARLDSVHDPEEECGDAQMKHLLPLASVSGENGEGEALYVERLDEDTRLRRRLYELVLGAKCPMLSSVDGRHFERERVFAVDKAWQQLIQLGVVERVDSLQ